MHPQDAFEDALVASVRRRRLIAWLLDATLIAALVGLAWQVTLIFGIITLGLGMPLMSLLPVIPLLYTWLLAASPMGATPGMAICGLILVRDEDLTRPGLGACFVWALGYYISIAAGVIWFAACLLTRRKRTIHDLVAGLTVVRTKALTDARGFGIIPPGGTFRA
jgi:uncharacterized RDD family membrane protein YckC